MERACESCAARRANRYAALLLAAAYPADLRPAVAAEERTANEAWPCEHETTEQQPYEETD